jgi:pimeloyl-ACP methyl ester carboxylesterase
MISRKRWLVMIALGVLGTTLPIQAQSRGDAATMAAFQLPSHGSMLNALMYVAVGPGPHPVVILLHGFPGNEKNLDLAQDIRRAGWDVLYFNYRGSWGSPGDFSFTHGIEDVASAIAYLKQPENAKRLRVDPTRIVLVGHSMGGLMAVEGAAADPTVAAVGLISAADMVWMVPPATKKQADPELIGSVSKSLAAEGMAPLAGCTPESLAKEVVAHADAWRFPAKAEVLKTRPALIVTSDDGLAPSDDLLAAALRKDGDAKVTAAHFATDHGYSDKRLELSKTVLDWLKGLPAAPR